MALNLKAGEKGQRDGLNEVQHAILQIDVYAVHISDLYRSWLAEKYPFFHLIFIPAGCTPVAQVLDLHNNRPFKHFFKRLFQSFLATEVSKQLAEGADPQSVRLEFSMSKMKPLTLGWLLDSWQHVKSLAEGCKRCYEKVGTLKALKDFRYKMLCTTQLERLFGCKMPEEIQAMVSTISEDLQHCTTEQFVVDVDDDFALTPDELLEGLNGNVMGSELEAVENESAWEPQECQEPSTEEQPASCDQLSSMTESELADYVGKSIKNALETRIPGVDKPQKNPRGRPPGSKNKANAKATSEVP